MYTKAAIGCFLFLTTIHYIIADVSHLSGGGTSPGLHTRSFNQQNWNIRDNIPGEPDVDYPIYSIPPISSFSCKGKHYGYYADVEARCQVFRVCANTDLTGKGFAFLCPNGTLFNQKFFVCDWYKNVDCSASAGFFSRNEYFGTRMGLMSENDMMSMVQGMVDYTKQPQFSNQQVNNNGGFPFTNLQVPKQLGNGQGLINQNSGLSSNGNGNLNNQQQGNIPNQGRANNNAQNHQRGSEILSQPIFPSENNRLTTPSQSTGISGNVVSNTGSRLDFGRNPDSNFNSNNAGNTNKVNNLQEPIVFVSSLGEISTDPNLRFNPFTTALVNTRTFDTLSSNVDPVSTSADLAQKFTSHGQFNQLSGNTQPKTQINSGFIAGQFQPNEGLNNRGTLPQEINHLSAGQSNQQGSIQNERSRSQSINDSNRPASANDQSGQTLTAVYTGSGDLLSHTIGQYDNKDSSNSNQSGENTRDPSLSALVNSLGETILTPIYTGEGNLLSQTIGQRGSSTSDQTQQRQQNLPATTRQGISTPQPILQTPHYNEQTSVTIAPVGTTGSNVQDNASKINVVYSGEGNLLSQTIAQKQFGGQGVNANKPDNSAVYSGESNSLSQSIRERGSQSEPSQVDQKQTVSITANRLAVGQQYASTTSGFTQGSSPNNAKYYSSSVNQPTTIASDSTITQATQSIPSSYSPSFGQRSGQQVIQSNQQLSPSNVGSQVSSFDQSYNNRVSFGQKLSSKSADIITTAIPYSPSIPPFRSTTTSVYSPTATSATSYSQRTQTYDRQGHPSRSYTQNNNFQSTLSNNQFQVPSKEYLPSGDSTRTARTNEFSFGNHGASRSSSFQNFARNGGSQQDTRQQFTYPVDQTDSKLLDNTNDLPNLGIDADSTKQNLTNRDVTHINKYLYRNEIEPTKNETGESTVTLKETNLDVQASISINDIFDLNRILQEGGNSEDITSEDIKLSPIEVNVTSEETDSEFTDFKRSPIVVAPVNDDDGDGASNDIEDSEVLRKFDESANLLFAGLQLSLYEQKEILNSEIKNELNDDIFRTQDIYEPKIRNPKDVHSSGGGLKQSNSIKLIFERAKNRSNNFRVKLKSRKEEENKAKRTFALPQKTAEENLVTILKPLLKNITITPNRYLENNTKIGGFINNDLKFSIGEPRQKHSLAPRILFKNVKTIDDIERIATGFDKPDNEDEQLTSETRLSNQIAFPDSVQTITDSDIQPITASDQKMTISSLKPSVEIVDKDKDWSYYTKTMFFPQRTQPRPVKDHETASSNQQNYASIYSSTHSQQSSQQGYPSSTYNQYPQYQQQQPQQPIHYATIDNRPNPSHSTFQAPPLQSNYPTSIQNNPQSAHSSYHSVSNRYIPSVPSAIPSAIPSSIPPSLPSIVHSSSQFATQPSQSFSNNPSPRTTSNEKVVVNIIPATGWYLNDANERQSFLDAVSQGLLSDKGFVYVNDVQSSQRQSNFNTQPSQVQGRSQIDIDEEAYFRGSSSYESPLNSVGHLPGDSDSVSGLLDSDTSGSPTSSSPSSGYQYQHPRRSFDV